MSILSTLPWSGRLILPQEPQRSPQGTAWIELTSCPKESSLQAGDRVELHWPEADELKVVTDLKWSSASEQAARRKDAIPIRLRDWKAVKPLESLAGARSEDTFQVALEQASWDGQRLTIHQAPVEVSGPQRLGLRLTGHQGEWLTGVDVRGGSWSVKAQARPERVDLDRWLGQSVWIYGAQQEPGIFEAASMIRQSQLTTRPDQVYRGISPSLGFLRDGLWRGTADRMNETRTVQLNPLQEQGNMIDGPVLGLHLFGGYQGPGGDPPRPLGVVGGHFAFATGNIHQGEIDLAYHQVYGQNPDQILSATQSQETYLGHFQKGWQYTRPIVDMLIQHPALSRTYDFGGGLEFRFFDCLKEELERMQARYRVGDGDGVAEINPATNCSQDSASAMFAVCRRILELDRKVAVYPQEDQYQDFQALVGIARDLQSLYTPWGKAPKAWEDNLIRLPAPPGQRRGTRALQALKSWKTMLPRTHQEGVAETFLRHGAQILVKSSSTVGAASQVEPPTAPTRWWKFW